MLKKIAITGPESTGKSFLSQSLAKHFNTLWVPEFARLYLNDLNRIYTADDIENIAEGQIELQRQNEKKASKFIFSDTELIVIKIWFENAFFYCPEWILKEIDKQDFDIYLLCDIDLPWEPDPLREHPDKRAYFFNLFKNELTHRNMPFEIISGIGERRILNAIEAVKKIS